MWRMGEAGWGWARTGLMDIVENRIGSEGAEALKSCTNLQLLDICENRIGSKL